MLTCLVEGLHGGRYASLQLRGKGAQVQALFHCGVDLCPAHQWYVCAATLLTLPWPTTPLTFQDLDGHLEGEHELVLLEEAQACVAVHIKGEGLHDVVQPVLQHDVLLAGVEGLVEHGEECAQAVLVPERHKGGWSTTYI